MNDAEREHGLTRLKALGDEQTACEAEIQRLNGEVETVRTRVRPRILELTRQLQDVAAQIDDLRRLLGFPRAFIG